MATIGGSAGFRGQVSRSTLADANETRDWRIYADFASLLIAQARRLYCDQPLEVGADLQRSAYAFDSTTIDLCLSLCPWAPFQRSRGAISEITPSVSKCFKRPFTK